ncbi:MAG TPA: thiamine pyrophosphate-dependent enzyme, partial [Thermomicrobiales bacterium]|nr:thiamine pyrophosphate-dependent enzyme [Thermomicrobiales bacterium]
ILLFEQRLREAGILTDDVQQAIQTRVSRIIEEAITSAERAPHPDASELLHNVYAPGTPLGS